MSYFEHLDALRRQNQELLANLKHTAEQLQRLKLAHSREEAENEAPRLGQASIVTKRQKDRSAKNDRRCNGTVTVAVGVKSPHVARKALCKAKIKSTDTTDPEDATYASLLQDQVQPEPSVFSRSKDLTGQNHLTTPDQELDSVSKSERCRVQPLLGYDWIAGLLDAETSLTERSEQFFGELRTFRQVNKEECVHSQSSGLPFEAQPWTSPSEDDVPAEECTPDTHQCTFCYRINPRLFAVPLDSQAACPICKTPKAKHPHTEKEPAYIRVSIPRSALLPAYRYRAHRRSSFDSSDSLSLPSHCLSGWSSVTKKADFRMTHLDLRSSVELVPNTDATRSAPPESQRDSTAPKVSGSRCSDSPLNVSRLAGYRFQHHGSVRKSNKCSYLAY